MNFMICIVWQMNTSYLLDIKEFGYLYSVQDD